MLRKNSSGKSDSIYAPKCDIYHICGNDICLKSCWFCNNKSCHDYCWNYKPFKCNRIDKAPFVCNGCPLTLSCKHLHYFYSARLADSQYRKTLVSSISGINCSPEELQNLDNLVSPLILKGQPLGHIYITYEDEIPCLRRTLYTYMDNHLLGACNIDLPIRICFKRRYKKHRREGYQDVNQSYRNRRSYKDFERFVDANPDAEVNEMDTVKGSRNGGKVVLTMLFRNSSFTLIFLFPQGKQKYIQDI